MLTVCSPPCSCRSQSRRPSSLRQLRRHQERAQRNCLHRAPAQRRSNTTSKRSKRSAKATGALLGWKWTPCKKPCKASQQNHLKTSTRAEGFDSIRFVMIFPVRGRSRRSECNETDFFFEL